MEIHIAEEVCSELKQLLLKQTETLKAQTFGGINAARLCRSRRDLTRPVRLEAQGLLNPGRDRV